MFRFLSAPSALLSLLLLVAGGWSVPAVATPSFDNCTGFVELAPNGTAGINAPGTWCLDHDLSGPLDFLSSGVRIQIAADDVVLDCKGFRVGGDPAQPRANYGVRAFDQSRLTIRNCVIEGFQDGIQVLWMFTFARDLLIEDNVLVDNNFAIETEVQGTLVRRNRVDDSIAGISVGEGGEVLDNSVSGVSDFGIGVVRPHGALVHGNTIRMPANDSGTTTGIRLILGSPSGGLDRASIRDNVIVAGANSVGIECSGPGAHYADNVFTGVATVATGCTDAGDNDVAP
jgi:hypothetical protein